MTRILAISLLALVATSALNAQNDFSFNVGAALPAFEFGRTDGEQGSGGAETGLNLSVIHRYHILADHLSWRSGLGFMVNPAQEMRISAFERLSNSETNQRASIYYSVPLETGLESGFTISKQLNLSLNIGLSLSYVHLSTWQVDASKRVEFNPAFNFGYKAGIELQLYRHFIIGFNYYDIGDYEVEARAFGFPGIEESQISYQQNMQQFVLALGYRF